MIGGGGGETVGWAGRRVRGVFGLLRRYIRLVSYAWFLLTGFSRWQGSCRGLRLV